MAHDDLHDELVQLTCDLIRYESVDARHDQLQAVIDVADAYCRAIGGVHVYRYEWAGRPSIVAALHPGKEPAIILNAHLDVVPALPTQYEPQIDGDRIYGRGSQDMKGSGAVLLRLLKDLAALPEPPNVAFQFVSDEEIGGMDGTNMLLQEGWRGGFFLAAEPTDLQICYAHKGAMWAEVHLRGTPAHGSRPWDGVNPFAALRDGLVTLEQRFPTPDEAAWVTTVVPTVVHGGDAGNRVPNALTVTLDIRRVPEQSTTEIAATLRECFPTGDVDVRREGPPLDTRRDDPQVQRLAACISAETGVPAAYMREHFATDARFYSDVGVPAVCLGPVGAGLHSDEEWVSAESLVQLYRILWRFVLEK